ncbi:MAG: glycerol kinase GlpK [Acidimicrobiia bacterium]|nr:glycerol kinase GlpK [Acidimicrobiia bacterium]MDX2468285.1 glycerol kinase GlpK [Acidimicrobiia bacterium]
MAYVGAIDQGTTSTRFAIVDHSGTFVGMAQKEHAQLMPQPGWVEHDASEIWANIEEVVAAALANAGLDRADLSAVGLTNQRETTLVWDKNTGEPVAPAIVWQDTRTDALCRELGGDEGADRFRAKTGLPLATYFAGPKLRWLLDNVEGLRERAVAGDVLFGTMDSWVMWKLTGEHVTDVTNASRTMLMDIDTLEWDDEIVSIFDIPKAMLPRIVPSIGLVGRGRGVLEGIPVAGILGDQQAAMFGQACFSAGEAKNTYGTGCFMLLNTGTQAVASTKGLLTTVAYQVANGKPRYALEGSVAIAGSGVQWLRDQMRMIEEAPDVEPLAASVEDNGDVYFVPAFSGLFAPYWRSDARGVIAGLTRFSEAGHVARAVLESVAYQSRDVLEAMEADSGVLMNELKVDGGMVVNELLMQFQADILDVDVVRPVIIETTVLGAAYAAGLATGYWSGIDELRTHWSEDRRFVADMDPEHRDSLYSSWNKAVAKSLDWVE